MPQFDLDDYVDVQERIQRFWQENPNGAIRTRLMSPPDDFTQCRYEAAVYKNRDSDRPDATGYAFELAGGRGPNSTSHEENCETSAIGRAFANMGYATSKKDRPSRQEMEKVARHDGGDLPARTRTTSENTVPVAGPGAITPAQMGMIRGLAEEKGIPPEKVREMHGKESAKLLTKQEASELIDRLQGRLEAMPEPPNDAERWTS